ncbi:MAG: insulinase family protein [Clostridia bacterium]|nr:insulinase family protein [Clostridia bacterium]
MQLTKKENKITEEQIYFGTHESGLNIYIMPKRGYKKTYAVFATKYGSVDSKFIVPGEDTVTEVPDGIAHFLEHKMFDQPDGSNVFDRFAKYGGNANAFTSFNMTAYLFSATSNVYNNLETLLNYVQSPYFTDESVQKEQGIIGQEIRMYDDNANWKVFFNFLGCLYQKNPVKLEIAGTIDSISKIDSKLLYRCYNTFYNLSNMTLFVIGDIDVEETLKVIESNILKNEPFKEEIKRIYPEEPKEIAKAYVEQKLSVAMPIFMMGFKDTDTGYNGNRLLKKNIEMSILIEMLFGRGSEVYKELYEQGLINERFDAEYNMQPDYAYTAIEGESNDPQKVYDIILKKIRSVREKGLSKDDFERIKKVVWGDYIRTHNDVEDYAHSFLSLIFMDVDYFDYYDVYKAVTFEDVAKRFDAHFDEKNAVLSVINPV